MAGMFTDERSMREFFRAGYEAAERCGRAEAELYRLSTRLAAEVLLAAQIPECLHGNGTNVPNGLTAAPIR